MGQSTIGYTGETVIHSSRSPMRTASESSEQDLKQMTDWLTAVAQQRCRDAYRQLFHYFAPRIRAYGLRHLRSEAQAMELVQDTLLAVWQKAHLYVPERGTPLTWVFTVMRNQCFDMLRRQMNSREQLLAEDLWPVLEPVDGSQQDERGEQQILARQLAYYVHLLPAAQQEVVRGVYLQEMTLQELADRLQVPLGTIKSRLRLALEKLREQVGKQDD